MSHTNITRINSTEINNSGPFRVGSQLTSGTAGQVLISQGNQVSPEWGKDTDTTYTGGTNINIDGSNNVNLDKTIISQNSIQFNIDGTSTTLTGSNYPSKPTVCSYLDLTSSTNIISPYFLHDVYDPVSSVAQSLSTGYVPLFSSNLSQTFSANRLLVV